MTTKNNSQTESVPDDRCNTLLSPPPTSCFGKMRIMWSTFKYSNILCCFKLKKQTDISILEYKIEKLKRNFGIDYLTLVGDDADVEDLKECLRVALEELDMLQNEIEDIRDEIYDKEARVNSKMRPTEFPKDFESAAFTSGEEEDSDIFSTTSPRKPPRKSPKKSPKNSPKKSAKKSTKKSNKKSTKKSSSADFD